MSSEWYVLRDGKKVGPYSTAVLKRMATDGQLIPNDHICKHGLTGWIPASRFAGLFSAGPASQAPVPAKAPKMPAEAVQSSIDDAIRPTSKRIFRRGHLVLASTAFAIACAGLIVFILRDDDSGSTLVEAVSNGNSGDSDPRNWSQKYYPQSNALLRTSARLAANVVRDREGVSQLEEIVQRAILLQEVATLQAEIGDIDGVESTLRLISELKPIAVGDTPLAAVVARAKAGELIHVQSADKALTAGFWIDADFQKAKLLRRISLAYRDRNDIDNAMKMLGHLAAHSTSIADPSQRALSLGELGKAQVALRRDDEVSGTVQNLRRMISNGAGLEGIRLAISDIATEWASVGEFQKAEPLLDLIGPSVLSDGCRNYVAERQAAVLDFRGATETAMKIDHIVYRARALIEIQKRRLECCPVYVEDALHVADELAQELVKTLSDLRAPATNRLYSVVLSEAAGAASRWRLATAADLSNSVRNSVGQRMADANVFIREALSDNLLEPQYRARILLAVAITAAKCDEPLSAAGFEECLKQVGVCAELSERRWLLQDIAFAYDQAGRTESILFWAQSQSTYDQAAVHLGIGRSQQQNEEVHIEANSGKIGIHGGIPSQPDSHATSNEIWGLLLTKLPLNCLRGDGYVIGRGSSRFLAVPVDDGVSFAFPADNSGIHSWLNVLSHAVLAGDEASLTAAALNLSLGEASQTGRIRVTKTRMRSPLEWVVITVQNQLPVAIDR